jgi:hypothetical protein
MLRSYGHYFAAISGVAEVSGNMLSPNMVMNHAVSKYNRQQIDNAPRHNRKPTGKSALYSFATGNSRSGQQGRQSGNEKEKCSCFNCGKEGHLKHDCKEPKHEGRKAKESGNSTSQGATAGSSKAPQGTASIVEVKEATPPPKDAYLAVAFNGYTARVSRTTLEVD